MPPLVLKLVFSTIHEQAPFFVRPFISIVNGHIQGSFIDPTVQNNFKLVDRYLSKDGGRQWLAGGSEPTGGDFMVSLVAMPVPGQYGPRAETDDSQLIRCPIR